MGAQIKVDGTDRSTNYTQTELGAVRLELSAFDGEVGQGSVPVPMGTPFEAYAGQRFQVIDTFAGALTILDGFAGGLQRERGDVATGRMNLVHVVSDDNALLYGFRAVKWSRPAESTRARFLAFIAAFVPSVTDTTWVTTTKMAAMPKKVYTTESLFSELQQDISDLTGNTAFLEHRRAHCHPFTEGIIGGFAISDTVYNYSTSFPPLNASVSRTKDPMDLGNNIRVKSPSGVATTSDATSISRHDSAGIKHQRYVEVSSGSAARQATEILASSKNERITYECDIGPLTAAQVDSIPVGCLVNVTSAVMGLSASTQRIAHMTLSYRNAPSGRSWMAHLEFGYPVRIRVKPPRTASPTDIIVPFDPQSDADLFVVPTVAEAGGGLLSVTVPVGDAGATSTDSVLLYDGCTYSVTMHLEAHHVSCGGLACIKGGFGTVGAPLGTGMTNAMVSNGEVGGCEGVGGPPTPNVYDWTGGCWVQIGAGGGVGDYAPFYAVIDSGPYLGACVDGSILTIGAVYVSGPDPRFADIAAVTVDPPEPLDRQQVNGEAPLGAVNGSNTAFATAYAGTATGYWPQSLRVWMNGSDVTDNVTETDPTTGAFAFVYPPPTGAELVVTYQAAPI
jgi:hypothetical protein